MPHDLETPGTDAAPEWSSLYRARGSEVVEYRPFFTGDVFFDVAIEGEADPKNVMILQHPCAIRLDGVTLAPKLLVAEVSPFPILLPSKWTGGYYKQLPLAELCPDGSSKHYAAMLQHHHIATPKNLEASERIACLAQRGVNLLMQRWVHHNTRVVVPTQMYQQVSSPQFEEADMIEDWCMDREADGVGTTDATREMDEWLSIRDGSGISRRDRLKDEQQRSALRREARDFLKSLRSAT